MILTAVLLAQLAVLLLGPGAALLAGAAWPVRAPRAALVLWQAIGLTSGTAAVTAGALVALAPLGPDPRAALAALWRGGYPVEAVGPAQVIAALATACLAGHLVGVTLGALIRTVAQRRRHRALLDLLATPMGEVRVLDHPTAVAYCLPGLRRSRVVLSAGAVAVLAPEELSAVLAHEKAHLAQRHDLVMLPFTAWRRALPFVPGVRRAGSAVAALVEMLADDQARHRHDPRVLARALLRVAAGQAPAGALAAGESAVLARVRRLVDPAPPVPRCLPLAAYTAALVLVTLPALAVLAPAV
ncbi:MAG: M56 family metallopeptidase [Mycobacteriales bacterium]